MANNVFGGSPNGVTAIANVSFAAAGINSSNTSRIYLIDNVNKAYLSYDAGSVVDPAITGFEIGKSYLIQAKMDMDLTAWVGPPFPSGSGILGGDIF